MLKEEFAKLQCPEGLESLCVSTRYPTASSNCTASKDVEVMDSSVACTKTDSSVDKDSAPTQKETDANDLPVENKDEDDHQEAFILS
jgi:hypothetical protein